MQGSESTPYAQVPIRTRIDSDEFLDAVFALPASKHPSASLSLALIASLP
jgi:hypothetical protein